MSDDIPSLLVKLGEMTCLYREYAQLADANRRRAEAAEARVKVLERPAKIDASCEAAEARAVDAEKDAHIWHLASRSLLDENERLEARIKELQGMLSLQGMAG